MGNKDCCSSRVTINHKHQIFDSIFRGSKKIFENEIIDKSPEDLDSLITNIDNLEVNPLGYCMICNRDKMFEMLIDKKCSIATMNRIFDRKNFHVLDYICSVGYIEIFKVYLPIYMNLGERNSTFSVNTINLDKSIVINNYLNLLPIHRACQEGNLNILEYMHTYFITRAEIPLEFNIESKDETYGENCALIACRRGHFLIVKYLHEQCKADFRILNLNKENALILALAGMNRNPKSGDYSKIIQYLICVVKLPIREYHEELLLIARNPNIVNFIEKKLQELGLDVTKDQIEEKYAHNNSGVLNYEKDIDPSHIFTDSFRKKQEASSGASSIKSAWSSNDYRRMSVWSSMIFK